VRIVHVQQSVTPYVTNLKHGIVQNNMCSLRDFFEVPRDAPKLTLNLEGVADLDTEFTFEGAALALS
jgi:hypothetical protein